MTSSKGIFVIFAALNASLGFFLYFYSISIFNSIQEVLQKYIFPNASITETSMFASAPLIGGLLGSILAQRMGAIFGRRLSMIITALISIIGVILSMLPNIPLFILGRILTSFDGGVSFVIVNIYINEISVNPLRGQIGTLPSIASSLGILVAFLLGGLMPYFIEKGKVEIGYRLLLSLPAVLDIVKTLNLVFVFKFETPFHLITERKEEEALKTLELLYDEEYSAKLREIIAERNYLEEASDLPLKELLKKKYLKAFMVTLPLATFLTFMGGLGPTIFSNMIFSEGMKTSYTESALMLTNLIAILGVLGGIISLAFLKYYGKRRTLALVGSSILAISNLAIALIAHFDSISSVAAKILITSWSLMASSTLAPLSNLYVAEVLPEIGVVVNSITATIFGIIMTQIFIPLKMSIGYSGLYSIFTCFSVIAVISFAFNLVETKDKTKLEIYKLYEGAKEEQESLIKQEKNNV